jgi:hypothetical protein
MRFRRTLLLVTRIRALLAELGQDCLGPEIGPVAAEGRERADACEEG